MLLMNCYHDILGNIFFPYGLVIIEGVQSILRVQVIYFMFQTYPKFSTLFLLCS